MFGEMVRVYRRRRGMSQEALAEACGLSVRGIRKIEGGHVDAPRPATIRLLADALGLTGVDRDLFLRATAGEAPAADPAVPRQLPADVHGFTGRVDQLAQLDASLPERGDLPPMVVISAIGGTAGVGKTALAVHWAHQVADRFPDGQLYVNLRGFDPSGAPVDPRTAVAGFLGALGVPPQRIPADEQAQYGLYRSSLAGRRMLIVLDNARDAEQVRPLLPGEAGCLALVTSRNSLSGLVASTGARTLTLDLLSQDEARRLLAQRIGSGRVVAEPSAVDEIIERCARLPLALVIVAAHATSRPDLPLTTHAEQLRRQRQRLDVLGGDDPVTDVRTVFSWSYNALDAGSARLFRLLGIHPGPDISTAAAASLCGQPQREVARALRELTRAHLIDQAVQGRYSAHDLLRGYARELAESVDPEGDRRDAVLRALDHYLHTGHAAALLLWPPRTPLALPAARPGAAPEALADQTAAQLWFSAEEAVLLSAVGWTADVGLDAYAWRLAWTLEDFLDRRGESAILAKVQQTGLHAARRHGDLLGQARMHHGLARALFRQALFEDAAGHLRHAFDRYGDLDDQVSQADTLRNLALVQERQGHLREALDTAHQALRLYPAGSHPSGRGQTLNGIGWLHAQLGEFEQTLTYCEQALAVLRECDDPTGTANTLDSLGKAHQQLGHHHAAIDCYQDAIEIYRYLGHRLYCAKALTWLGDTHSEAGDADAAAQAWRDALALLDELDDPEAHRLRQGVRQSLGLTDQQTGR